MKNQKKILYFDCSSGISGDMTLGALLDLGLDREQFLRELAKLHLDGYEIEFETTQRNAITATHVNVKLTGEAEDTHHQEMEAEHAHGEAKMHTHSHGTIDGHDHGAAQEQAQSRETEGKEHIHGETGHTHGHEHRRFRDIRGMIQDSELDPEVKDLALRIFTRVAEAEGKVHRRPMEEVQFHEVGAVDSIVDIVGSAILIHMICPDAVYASVIQDGYGFVECQHGQLSVPVPAVTEIFAASKAVVRQIDVDTELVTPTGAAIIAELADGFGTMPAMRTEKVGWGAGTKILKIPNLLKVTLGERWEEPSEIHQRPDPKQAAGGMQCAEQESAVWEAQAQGQERKQVDGTRQCVESKWDQDEILVLRTNLDDCTGEMLGAAMERLLEVGALDVFYTPIFMKKNRPAWMLTALCRPEDGEKIEAAIFRHTTTIGIRGHLESRSILRRETGTAQTPFGELEVKRVRLGQETRSYPEYESAVKLAEQTGRSLWEIIESYEKR